MLSVMKGIALILLQIGHLDRVCFLMRHDTVARSLSLSLSLSLYQDEVCPFFTLGGFLLFYLTSWHMYLGERVVFVLLLKKSFCVYIYKYRSSLTAYTDSKFLHFSAHACVQFAIFLEMLTEFT